MSTSFPPRQDPVREGDPPLARAFRSFTEAAGSLERTYGQLQGQVTYLRQELEVTNQNLTVSLEENRRIRERQRRILEGLPCGVLVVDAEKRVSILNPEAARLLGGKLETGDCASSIDIASPEMTAALDEARTSGQEQEVEVVSCEVESREVESRQVVRTPPAPVWVAIRHAWLEQDPEGESSIFILRDTSAAKQMEREREGLRRQQALVEMSALLAHEIRNPLGSLELFAGLLAESGLKGESRRWIDHVRAGLRSLSATVNNVLDLHSEPQAEPAALDAGDLLAWAYDFLLPLARQARVELEIINGLGGVKVAADRHLLEQVVLNLALNAFHFMAGGGWLSIRGGERDREHIEIEVKDTGPGIAEEDIVHIFEAGFTTRPGSTGLGLAVCRRIAEQHGGSIEVESRHGWGATFRLCLPKARMDSGVTQCGITQRDAKKCDTTSGGGNS